MTREAAQDALNEYLGTTKASNFTLVRIHRKEAQADFRAVYAAYSDEVNYALKVDLTEGGADHLRTEFQWLMMLRAQMVLSSNHSVIEPCHLSGSAMVMITRLCDFPSLRDVALRAATRDELSEVMNQSGAWTQAFHTSAPKKVEQFWPGWMFKHAQELRALKPASDVKAALADRAIKVLVKQSEPFRGATTSFGRRHDDLNGMNLLIGPIGETLGLDLPGTREGMQLTDAAQLMCDIDLHQNLVSNEAPDVSPPVYYGFCKGYAEEINHDLLRFLCRMQFLFIWLRITPDRIIANRNVRLRDENLEARMYTLVNG